MFFLFLFLFFISLSPQKDYPKIDLANYIRQEKSYSLEITSPRKIVFGAKVYRISHYSLSKDETDNSPEYLSCGHIKEIKKRKDEVIIALSQDLFFDKNRRKIFCGKRAKVILPDGKVYHGIVFDTMNKRYKRAVDILVENKNTAKKLGVKNFGKVYIYEE